MVGHDTGYIIAYALAADHRDRVERLVVAEIPGPPGVVDPEHDPPPLFLPEFLNNRLWHIPFNRVNDELIINMVRTTPTSSTGTSSRSRAAGRRCRTRPSSTTSSSTPATGMPCAPASGSTGPGTPRSRRTSSAQEPKLTIPVLGIGGANSWGPFAADGIKPAAIDVQTAVIPDTGHWVAEQAPEQMLELLADFLGTV